MSYIRAIILDRTGAISINQFICQSQERLEAKELTIRSWNSRSQEQEHNDLKNTKQTQNTKNIYNTNVGQIK